MRTFNRIALGIALSAGLSSAAIIDFEDLGVAVGTQLNPASGVGVITGGFNYTPGPNNDSGLNDLHISNQETFLAYNGTTVGGSHDDVVLTKVTGGLFSLQQFDFAGFPTNAEVAFTVTGELFGGGNVVVNFTPDGLVDGGPGGVVDFQTFFLPGTFVNLTSVTWTHTGAGTAQGLFFLDNIGVDGAQAPVPEPATFLMIGAGLAALGIWKRRS